MSIWFAKAFIGVVLCKNGCWMRTLLSEEEGDGGFRFIAWKRRIVICSEMHAVSADLPFHSSDTKLGPARKFAVDSARFPLPLLAGGLSNRTMRTSSHCP